MDLATFLAQLGKLPCWHPDCHETFQTFTELSNHHLEIHERPVLVVACDQCEAAEQAEGA